MFSYSLIGFACAGYELLKKNQGGNRVRINACFRVTLTIRKFTRSTFAFFSFRDIIMIIYELAVFGRVRRTRQTERKEVKETLWV